MISPSVTLTANNTITWDAKHKIQHTAYPDGYQLLISTTTPTVVGFTANQPLFSISAENSTWTKRTIDLDAARLFESKRIFCIGETTQQISSYC